MRFRALTILVATVAVAAVGASSAAVSKVMLTVVVSGNGGVVSRPAGIVCPGVCKMRVRRGTRVTLTASPAPGSTLSDWTRGCTGTSSNRCTVTMTRSRVVSVSFKTPPPPPPPPPPPAKGGHYQGTYSDGTFINFDVGQSGLSVGNIRYDENGHCNEGSTSYGEGGLPGPYAIRTDGSFQGTYSYNFSDGNGTVTITGKFSPNGSASGSLTDSFTFTSGDASGVSCTSTGTWSATPQP